MGENPHLAGSKMAEGFCQVVELAFPTMGETHFPDLDGGFFSLKKTLKVLGCGRFEGNFPLSHS